MFNFEKNLRGGRTAYSEGGPDGVLAPISTVDYSGKQKTAMLDYKRKFLDVFKTDIRVDLVPQVIVLSKLENDQFTFIDFNSLLGKKQSGETFEYRQN